MGKAPAKKKIAIEEGDSGEAPKKAPAKKKIAIEEVDSGEAPKKAPAKKKIAIDEVDRNKGSKTTSPTVVTKESVSSQQGSPHSPPVGLLKRTRIAPKTGYDFERTLEGCKTPADAAEYIGIVKPASAPKLLRQNLSVEILQGISSAVAFGLPGGTPAGLKWMQALTKTNRFDIIVDFLSDEEKTIIGEALAAIQADGM